MYLEGETIMQLTTVKELFKEREKYLDKEITVGGWIRSIRDSKAFGFIVLNDGTSFDTLQIVYHDTMANFAEVSKLNVGASIIVKGTLVATPDQSSRSRSRRQRLLLKALPARITRSRKSVTPSNTFVRSRTFVRVPTPSRLYSVCVP